MDLTIAYITGRADPRLDWLTTSLAFQANATDIIRLLVIDSTGKALVNSPTARWPNITVATPKPNPWQGKHRLTARDCWAKSNAINTALVLCQTDYIAFVDDRCSLGVDWLSVVREYERSRTAVVVGSYEKYELHGTIYAKRIADEPRSVPRVYVTKDTRLDQAPLGRANCGGGWLYGCTYALPLEWALEVNGAEEGCDGMGTEDYIFGLMLANGGRRIDYAPSMRVIQRRDEVLTPGTPTIPLWRSDKGVSPNDKSHAALARFGKRNRTEFTPDLRKLRDDFARGRPWPLPDPDLHDWFDGQPIREMGR